MIVRELTVADQPFLWEALYYAIHVLPGEAAPDRDIVNSPELACYVENWMQVDGDQGVVAESDGTPVGAAWLRCWTTERRGFGYVDSDTPELSVAVLPGFRDQGRGTRLLTQLMTNAAQRFAGVSLSVSETNPACRLYQRLGFEPTGKCKDDSFTMIRRFR